MTLNEFKDPAGNAMVMLLNRTPWHMPVTETAKLGSTEIWALVNLTDDTHPIHLHHVRFQVVDRRAFDRDVYLLQNATLRYTVAPLAPNPNELGWKDVVQCPPNMVTRIHISFAGYPGRYLWHCHVQEHEANDMMRPYEIVDEREAIIM
jgi:spore coat protein A